MKRVNKKRAAGPMKKSLLMMSALLAAGSVSADNFNVDVGTNYHLTGLDKVTDTSTSMKKQFTYQYESNTVISDTDGSGSISAGDTLVAQGGMAVGDLGHNQVTGFTSNQVFRHNSNNGYGTNYLLSFSLSGFDGVVTSVVNNVPYVTYGAGLLQMYITFDGVTLNNFMDINITQGATTGFGTEITGQVDFTNVDAGYNNLFHSGSASCAGSSGFFDIWSSCGDTMSIDFFADFNTNVKTSQFSTIADGFGLTSNHDGSATFAVTAIPEPATYAMLLAGLGLVGFAARRRAA